MLVFVGKHEDFSDFIFEDEWVGQTLLFPTLGSFGVPESVVNRCLVYSTNTYKDYSVFFDVDCLTFYYYKKTKSPSIFVHKLTLYNNFYGFVLLWKHLKSNHAFMQCVNCKRFKEVL